MRKLVAEAVILLTGFTYFQSFLPVVLLFCLAQVMCKNVGAEVAGLKLPNEPVADWDLVLCAHGLVLD